MTKLICAYDTVIDHRKVRRIIARVLKISQRISKRQNNADGSNLQKIARRQMRRLANHPRRWLRNS